MSGGGERGGNNAQTNAMNKLHNEGQELKRTLLLTYTGSRLRRTFDWTLSHIEDDVSHFTQNLTEMERRLFDCGASASHAYAMWKLFGTRKIQVSQTALRANIMSITAKTGSGNRNANTNTQSEGGSRDEYNSVGRRDGGSKRGLLSKRSVSHTTTSSSLSSSRFVPPDYNMTRKRIRSN